MLENLEIRLRVVAAKVTYREIARHIGITPQHLSRCLRYPLKPEMRDKITAAIDELRRATDVGDQS